MTEIDPAAPAHALRYRTAAAAGEVIEFIDRPPKALREPWKGE